MSGFGRLCRNRPEKLVRTRGFKPLMMGRRARVWSLPGGAELLVPQLSLRRIAYRAVQVAILAAGILAILLVSSRQAHAATSTPSASAPSAAASAASSVTSAAASA